MSATPTLTAVVQPFTFTTLAEAYALPEESRPSVVEDLLPVSGLSILAGKPKCGKSTFTRQLAAAVAMGTPFLGRATQQGKVVYFALEEKTSEVTSHFRDLEVPSDAPIMWTCDPVADRQKAVVNLDKLLQKESDVRLVVIDTLFRFVRIQDGSDYWEVNDALGQLLALARRYPVHILGTHHEKKRQTVDLTDACLGSTAITASVDTLLALRRDASNQRTLTTTQKYGKDLAALLLWDEGHRTLSLGPSVEDAVERGKQADREALESAMLNYVAANPGCTYEALVGSADIPAHKTRKIDANRRLIGSGQLIRHGTGKKGDPFVYEVPAITA